MSTQDGLLTRPEARKMIERHFKKHKNIWVTDLLVERHRILDLNTIWAELNEMAREGAVVFRHTYPGMWKIRSP